MESGYWKLVHWKKIPVYAHWTILLWFPWVLIQGMKLVWLFPTFLAFITILLFHEFGHAIAARYTDTKVYAIKLFLMHGECTHETPYYESEDILIAWGGVLGQLLLLVLAVVAQYLLFYFSPMWIFQLSPVFDVLTKTNLIIIAFNLIPVKPLDGVVAWRIIPFVLLKIRTRKAGILSRFAKRQQPPVSKTEEQTEEQNADKIVKDLFDRLKK
jgi:stage IV sporulation protein FB